MIQISFNHTFGNCIGLTGGVLDINTDMLKILKYEKGVSRKKYDASSF